MTAFEEGFHKKPSHPQFFFYGFSSYGQIFTQLEINYFAFLLLEY